MGQGGMILTDKKKIYDQIIKLKTFNRSGDKSDWHEGFGLNFKITDLQSALGLSQFGKLKKFTAILCFYSPHLNTKQNKKKLWLWQTR